MIITSEKGETVSSAGKGRSRLGRFSAWARRWAGKLAGCGCFSAAEDACACAARPAPAGRSKIALVGNPNVGKSALFQVLTGTYATVSNYPGTTVEVTRGRLTLAGRDFEVIDTPGMYSLLTVTEEERVARSILWRERPDIVLHVADAKNLERMLPFTLQLLEAELPVILVLNIIDEAEKFGVNIDLPRLEAALRIPVVATASTTGRGVEELRRRIADHVRPPCA